LAGVGIGTTDPRAPLHVAGGSVLLGTRADAGGYTALTMNLSSANNGYASIQAYRQAGSFYGDLVLNQSGGNVGIGIAGPTNRLHVLGGATFSSGAAGGNQNVVWTPGSGSWSFTSDRNTKDRVEPVDAQSILKKVAHIPTNEWSYIGYDQRHIGPMAQDFHNQFPLNENDKALNDADLHGVALAAIQGLNQKLEQKDTEITELKARLEKLEQLLTRQNEAGAR